MSPTSPSPFRRTFLRSHSRASWVLVPLLLGCAALTIGCGSEAGADATSPTPDAAAKPSKTPGVQAAKAAETIDNALFTTVLPEGWEILADDLDKMGLMTLAKKGTGGSQGVYLKFEPNYKGDPMKNIEKMASSYKGSDPESVDRAGVSWARTRYTYSGIEQSLNITAHGGKKVTFTVMGEDYDQSPGVKAIFDGLKLK